jgi:hypothetical protein
LALQLSLKEGQQLRTAGGRELRLSAQEVKLDPAQIGGSIGTDAWSISTLANARFVWPIHPYNPYADAPEPGLGHAVGLLTVPLDRNTPELSLVITVGSTSR